MILVDPEQIIALLYRACVEHQAGPLGGRCETGEALSDVEDRFAALIRGLYRVDELSKDGVQTNSDRSE
jgi:hypothetical protein